MRVPFNELFVVSDRGINPRTSLQIGVYVLTPDISGNGSRHVDLHRYVGMDAEVVTDRITKLRVIQGFYSNQETQKSPEQAGRTITMVPNKKEGLLKWISHEIISLLPFRGHSSAG